MMSKVKYEYNSPPAILQKEIHFSALCQIQTKCYLLQQVTSDVQEYNMKRHKRSRCEFKTMTDLLNFPNLLWAKVLTVNFGHNLHSRQTFIFQKQGHEIGLTGEIGDNKMGEKCSGKKLLIFRKAKIFDFSECIFQKGIFQNAPCKDPPPAPLKVNVNNRKNKKIKKKKTEIRSTKLISHCNQCFATCTLATRRH